MGCTTTAVAVNRKSARTTSAATAAITRTSWLRWARHMKKAMPAPVPNNTVDETMCSHFSNR